MTAVDKYQYISTQLAGTIVFEKSRVLESSPIAYRNSPAFLKRKENDAQ